ncbi:hypothetical protein C8J55DRAFT_493273 [Lentinula edodes]|uniref:Uncharacterized protein n=1 Tax=Lentinula lateritia TaxID=40482 RepID=A0A9W9DE39_9AGAR|nr:hypothetical protein C8J55DRAFT_493273 [Lentinula edodes]
MYVALRRRKLQKNLATEKRAWKDGEETETENVPGTQRELISDREGCRVKPVGNLCITDLLRQWMQWAGDGVVPRAALSDFSSKSPENEYYSIKYAFNTRTRAPRNELAGLGGGREGFMSVYSVGIIRPPSYFVTLSFVVRRLAHGICQSNHRALEVLHTEKQRRCTLM